MNSDGDENSLVKGPVEQWAIVELFGHQRIAGRISEHVLGGVSFVRIDVPALPQGDGKPDIPALTKLFGQGAIYGIAFVDEVSARLTASTLRVQPIASWDLREALAASGQAIKSLGLRSDDDEHDCQP